MLIYTPFFHLLAAIIRTSFPLDNDICLAMDGSEIYVELAIVGALIYEVFITHSANTCLVPLLSMYLLSYRRSCLTCLPRSGLSRIWNYTQYQEFFWGLNFVDSSTVHHCLCHQARTHWKINDAFLAHNKPAFYCHVLYVFHSSFWEWLY